jgi:hypothetical protein
MERRRYVLAIALALLILTGAGCGTIEPYDEPEEAGEPSEPSATATAALPEPTPVPTPIVEERTAEVEWPGSMRVGDGEVIRLSLYAPTESGYISTPEVAGHEVQSATVPIPLTRAGYEGYVSASLTTTGLDMASAAPRRQKLAPGHTNTWRWTISASRPGTYRPVINLTVVWDPKPGEDLPGPIEEAVWGRVLTVEARAPLGLSGTQVDWLGVGGTLLGTAAGFPFMEKVLSILWKRLRRKAEEPVADG